MKESQVTREQVNVKLNISNYRKISADESEEQKVFFFLNHQILVIGSDIGSILVRL